MATKDQTTLKHVRGSRVSESEALLPQKNGLSKPYCWLVNLFRSD